jgi:hypothetical protein
MHGSGFWITFLSLGLTDGVKVMSHIPCRDSLNAIVAQEKHSGKMHMVAKMRQCGSCTRVSCRLWEFHDWPSLSWRDLLRSGSPIAVNKRTAITIASAARGDS